VTAQRAPTGDALLTIPEAAAALRISERSFFRLMAEGHIHAVKIGGRTLIKATEIERFIDALDEA
jgi:excisionase family DNA binding protein